MGVTDKAPLGLAKEWLRERVDDGVRCPCCNQFAKVYKRKVNSGMARSLIRMYRVAGTNWQHIPTTIPARSREEGKLRYWGLAEEAQEPREDGGRAGWWRVTPAGYRWVRQETTVPKYAYIYDGRLLRLDGVPTNIKSALGDKFDYEELMKA